MREWRRYSLSMCASRSGTDVRNQEASASEACCRRQPSSALCTRAASSRRPCVRRRAASAFAVFCVSGWTPPAMSSRMARHSVSKRSAFSSSPCERARNARLWSRLGLFQAVELVVHQVGEKVERVRDFGVIVTIALQPNLETSTEECLSLHNLAPASEQTRKIGKRGGQRGRLGSEPALADGDCSAVQRLDERLHRELAARLAHMGSTACAAAGPIVCAPVAHTHAAAALAPAVGSSRVTACSPTTFPPAVAAPTDAPNRGHA
eukprot:scaffold22893_cov27-Tisochrysis_lutea.AAC.9